MIMRSPRFLTLSLLVAPLALFACSSTSGGSGSGGAASGGKTGSGGSATGGSATGGSATGGSATGGSATGGSATGGSVGSGGAPATGGTTGSGGVSGTGGGGTASGGASGTGGAAAGGSNGGNKGGGGTAAGGGGGSSNPCAFNGGSVTAALYPKGLTLTKACSPYTINTVDGITVNGDGVLTIEAGTTIHFDVNTAILVGKDTNGKLLANGTAQAPIKMTSVAMDVNGEGWYGLQFYDGTVTGSIVSYTTIEYAGGNFDAAVVGEMGMPKNSVTLDHLTVNNNNTCAAPVMVDPATSFIIKTCTADGKPCPAP